MKQIVILILVAFLSMLAAYTYMHFDSHSTDDKHLVKVGLSADYPPFETMKDGQVIGFDVDLIKSIAQELDLRVVIKDMPFYSLIASLEAGKIDVAISAINITPEREQKVAFSDNYYYPQLSFVYLKDNPAPNAKNLNNIKLGVQTGTTMEQWAKKAAVNTANVHITSMDTNPVLLEELKNKRLDTVVIETLQAKEFCKQDPKLTYTQAGQSSFGYSIAFAKRSSLAAKVNKALKALQERGVIKQLEQKWLS